MELHETELPVSLIIWIIFPSIIYKVSGKLSIKVTRGKLRGCIHLQNITV
jgi:hypothetical protein